jgi:hypothetical protein
MRVRRVNNKDHKHSTLVQKGNMKLEKTAYTIAYEIISAKNRGRRAGLRALLLGGLTAGLLASQPVNAITVTPLGKGQLPSGDFIVMTQLTLNPGESVGWHYHPGNELKGERAACRSSSLPNAM